MGKPNKTKNCEERKKKLNKINNYGVIDVVIWRQLPSIDGGIFSIFIFFQTKIYFIMVLICRETNSKIQWWTFNVFLTI
jgi:hypothetical protein